MRHGWLNLQLDSRSQSSLDKQLLQRQRWRHLEHALKRGQHLPPDHQQLG